jgi:pimeloyl-ACP methyl ester carboxylesterase
MSRRTAHYVLTSDGVRISFSLLRSPEEETALVVCPGFFKSKETATFRRLSEALAEERDVVTMDFRGHGRSGGRYTFSAREGSDLEAVLAWMEPRYRAIGVLGFSLGAAIAINTVSRRPGNVRCLIAVSAPAVFRDIEFKWWTPEAIRRGVLGLRPGAGCRPGSLWLKKEKPLERIARLASMPVLLIHGTRDMIVDAKHSRRLYAAAREPKRLEIIEQGSHAEAMFQDRPEEFVAMVSAWFKPALE